jgi:hypothetical protein
MLTDEDKQWFANHIAERIAESEERMSARIAQTEERISARVAQTEERMSARIEKTETALLTEFHKWASPVEMRQRTHAAAFRAIDAEMEALSDRVKKLEAS